MYVVVDQGSGMRLSCQETARLARLTFRTPHYVYETSEPPGRRAGPESEVAHVHLDAHRELRTNTSREERRISLITRNTERSCLGLILGSFVQFLEYREGAERQRKKEEEEDWLKDAPHAGPPEFTNCQFCVFIKKNTGGVALCSNRAVVWCDFVCAAPTAMSKRKMSLLSSFENISPQVISRVGREIQDLQRK